MFVGAVPKPAIEQITRSVPFDEWGEVFVGCSGSFRFDRAVKARHPTVKVHSNDVSLLSCSIGALATGAEFDIEFVGDLAFVQDVVGELPFLARVAAVEVVMEMAKYRAPNIYAVTHYEHYRSRFRDFLAPAMARLESFLVGLDIDSFLPGDFRQQAQRAAAAGGGVATFSPTWKNGYERLYRFLDENTRWDRPAYDVWDPANLESWMDELDAIGVRYCILADHAMERREPTTVYVSDSNHPIYTFSDKAAASIRRASHHSQPFGYRPLDPDAIGPRSVVDVVHATSAQMNFLKDAYLAKGIAHTSGMANFLVFVDGCLAGGFIYTREKYGGNDIYLLSDFALAPKSRISKLIAMMATCRTITRRLEIKFGKKFGLVKTTAFTNKPTSMKYRGIYELTSRKPGMLNYASEIRDLTPQQIYIEWFQRFIANARHPGGVPKSKASGEKRPVHEGAGVQ
jgi:hypothetical protein